MTTATKMTADRAREIIDCCISESQMDDVRGELGLRPNDNRPMVAEELFRVMGLEFVAYENTVQDDHPYHMIGVSYRMLCDKCQALKLRPTSLGTILGTFKEVILIPFEMRSENGGYKSEFAYGIDRYDLEIVGKQIIHWLEGKLEYRNQEHAR